MGPNMLKDCTILVLLLGVSTTATFVRRLPSRAGVHGPTLSRRWVDLLLAKELTAAKVLDRDLSYPYLGWKLNWNRAIVGTLLAISLRKPRAQVNVSRRNWSSWASPVKFAILVPTGRSRSTYILPPRSSSATRLPRT